MKNNEIPLGTKVYAKSVIDGAETMCEVIGIQAARNGQPTLYELGHVTEVHFIKGRVPLNWWAAADRLTIIELPR